MKSSAYARRETGDRAEHKLARCLLIWALQEAGALPASKCALAADLGVSRFTIDRDLATIEAAKLLVKHHEPTN